MGQEILQLLATGLDFHGDACLLFRQLVPLVLGVLQKLLVLEEDFLLLLEVKVTEALKLDFHEPQPVGILGAFGLDGFHEPLISIQRKELHEGFPPLVGILLEELGEFPLGQDDDAGEFIHGEPQQVCQGGVGLPLLVAEELEAVSILAVYLHRFWLGGCLAVSVDAISGKLPPNLVALVLQLEGEGNARLLIRRGEVGADSCAVHLGMGARELAVECVGDGVEDGGLSGTRLSANKEHVCQLGEVNGLTPEWADVLQVQQEWLHLVSSRIWLNSSSSSGKSGGSCW